ncbi:MAG: cysteine peptidase family C39 domain-containing protein [Ignavibacteriales bacterium]|nr:cysteine peptidase family C39 domain-containing protein [Ignavibacteriales bacterium]
MFLVQIKTVITICVVVFLVAGFALAVAVRFSDPRSGYEIAAHERGGSYLGIEGVIMQDKSNTCGPAALKMILDAHGKKVQLGELEKRSDTSYGGWSMQSLKGLAEQSGLRAEGWRLDLDALCRSRFPVILFVENRHFVVADSVDSAGFFVVRDPAIGRMKIHRRALGKIWTGETLVFGENRSPCE